MRVSSDRRCWGVGSGIHPILEMGGHADSLSVQKPTTAPLACLGHARMAEAADRFTCALALDAIQPIDF
jgi:hypothetical protein